MKRIKVLGLAIVAVLAISAMAVASASAVKPEWSMTNAKVTFTGAGGAGTLESTTGTKVKCTSNTSAGQLEKEKATKKVVVKYKGCKEGVNKCSTAGAGAEEIVTKSVEGTLVYVNALKTKVGDLLKPEGGGTEFVEFKCGTGLTVKVSGEVIGEASPLNTPSTTGKLKFEQAAGVQKFQQVEGAGTKHHLSAFGFVESGLESTETLTFAETVTLVA